MPVPVMDVRVMRVPMHRGEMPVDMHMRLAGRIARLMHMLVMRIMNMRVFVQHGVMVVFVFMPLGEVKV